MLRLVGTAAIRESMVDDALTLAYEQGAPIPVTLNRLRNTWLLRHVEAGTPLPILVAAAGLRTTSALINLMPYADIPADSTARRLREAST